MKNRSTKRLLSILTSLVLVTHTKNTTLAQVNLGDFTRIANSCFYESTEFYGNFPQEAVYKSDLELIQPDNFTASKQKTSKMS